MRARATTDLETGLTGRRFVLMSIAAFVAVAAAQLADLTTFLSMVAVVGIGAEANPLVSHAAQELGLTAVVIAKVGLITFVVMAFAIIAPVSRRLAASVLTLGTVAGLIGATSNVLAVS